MIIFFQFIIGINNKISTFAATKKRSRSSMDRISDSGSDDMGSIPVEIAR